MLANFDQELRCCRLGGFGDLEPRRDVACVVCARLAPIPAVTLQSCFPKHSPRTSKLHIATGSGSRWARRLLAQFLGDATFRGGGPLSKIGPNYGLRYWVEVRLGYRQNRSCVTCRKCAYVCECCQTFWCQKKQDVNHDPRALKHTKYQKNMQT